MCYVLRVVCVQFTQFTSKICHCCHKYIFTGTHGCCHWAIWSNWCNTMIPQESMNYAWKRLLMDECYRVRCVCSVIYVIIVDIASPCHRKGESLIIYSPTHSLHHHNPYRARYDAFSLSSGHYFEWPRVYRLSRACIMWFRHGRMTEAHRINETKMMRNIFIHALNTLRDKKMERRMTETR